MSRRGTELSKAADAMFSCGPAERGAFEAGIKLGALYHQFVGSPVSLDSVESLESGMTEAMSLQPYVVWAKVTVNREMLERASKRFGYASLSGKMLDASVKVQYGDVMVHASLRYVDELDYPLMYIEKVEKL